MKFKLVLNSVLVFGLLVCMGSVILFLLNLGSQVVILPLDQQGSVAIAGGGSVVGYTLAGLGFAVVFLGSLASLPVLYMLARFARLKFSQAERLGGMVVLPTAGLVLWLLVGTQGQILGQDLVYLFGLSLLLGMLWRISAKLKIL